MLQARYLLLDEPTAGLDPAGRTQMLAIIRRIVAQGNHVIISSHDIDLIYEISDAVYVLRQGQILTHGAPGEVFACTEAMEQAGLTQPWLVKLHTQLGLPLCKTETEFFFIECKSAHSGRRHDAGSYVAGDGIRRRQKCAGGRFMPHFFIRMVCVPRRLNRKIWRLILVLRRMVKRWGGRKFFRRKPRGSRQMCV